MPLLEEIQVVWRTDPGSPIGIIGEDSLWLCQQVANLKMDKWPSRNSAFTMDLPS